jgi:exopolysaccharide biosynthesis protein
MPLALLVATLLSAEPPAAAASWRTVAPGIEQLHLEDGDAELVRFDLGQYEADIVVPGPRRPLTAAAARSQAGGVLAVNGGFFDEHGRSLGLRIADGKVAVPTRRKVDWGVLLLRGGQAAIVHSRDYVPDRAVVGAVQVGPRIVVDGRPTPLKPQVARRTAVALDREGRFLTVLVTREAVAASDLAQALVRLGFENAIMLDGGPSSQLSLAMGEAALEIPGAYAVPDLVVVRPRQPRRAPPR